MGGTTVPKPRPTWTTKDPPLRQQERVWLALRVEDQGPSWDPELNARVPVYAGLFDVHSPGTASAYVGAPDTARRWCLISEDKDTHRGRQVPWIGIATLVVRLARFLLNLWRKG